MRQFHCLLTSLKLGKQTSLYSERHIKTLELLLPAAQSTIFFSRYSLGSIFLKVFSTETTAVLGVPSAALTTISKLQGQHAALVEVQLVLVGLVHVEDLHVAALHTHGQPLPGGAVPQGEDLQEQGGSLMSLLGTYGGKR